MKMLAQGQASTTTSQEAINTLSASFLMKPNYSNLNHPSSSSTRNIIAGVASTNTKGSNKEVLHPNTPVLPSQTKEEQNNVTVVSRNISPSQIINGETTTPMQHMMIKQYIYDVASFSNGQVKIHDRGESADFAGARENARQNSISPTTQFNLTESEYHRRESGGQYSSTMHSQKPQLIPRMTTATSFMPANRNTAQMKKMKLKKNIGSGAETKKGNQTRFKSPRDDEKIQKGKQRMGRYALTAQQATDGYSKMVQLNGGQAIGEENQQFIEKCIGIGEKTSPSNPKISRQEESKLKKLEEEQREIEAKLKFIDGLINQQSGSASNNLQSKYFGGGILKRQRTDEFVLSLEQYQRAINDLKMTMEALNVQSQVLQRQDSATGRFDDEPMMANEDYLKSKQIASKSGLFSEISKNEHQTNQGHIDEALSRQIQAKQVFSSVIPQVSQSLNAKPQMEDGAKSVMSSRPSTNNQARDQRKSMENKGSIRSSNYTGFTKLEHIGLQEIPQIGSNITSSREDSPHYQQKFSPNRKSLNLTDDGGSSAERKNSQCKLRVVTEVIINGYRNDQEEAFNNQQQQYLDGLIQSGAHCLRETIHMNNAVNRQLQGLNQNAIDMPKVDMVFEGPNKEPQHQVSVYEKNYKTHTEITNPLIVQQNMQVKSKAPESLSPEEKERWHTQSAQNLIQLKFNPAAQGVELKQKELNYKKLTQNKSENLQIVKAPAVPDLKTMSIKLARTEQNDESTVFDTQRLHEIGKKTVTQAIHGQERTRFEILDKNVMYQQDGDQSRGVLYFKNLDSLKNFLNNKKRPIFSKQGNKVLKDTQTTFKSFSNASKKSTIDEEEKARHLSADINKKREFLSSTLSTLMPSLQLKALKNTDTKMSFQQTVDYVQKKYMGSPTTQNQVSTAPTTSQQWASVQSQQQTLYNPIPKTQYLFDDIMNADGIIDLRFMGGASPSSTFYNNKVFNKEYGGNTNNMMQMGGGGGGGGNQRSETSPGNHRKPFNKRLQTFYGFSQIEQNIKKAKAMQDKGKSRNNLNQNASEATLSDSQVTNSSRNVTRQVVFFKTNNSSKVENLGGSYMLQYPQLRPRLNLEEGKSPLKMSSHTVGLHQKYMNKNVIPHVPGSAGVVQISGKQKFESIIRLSKDSVEKSSQMKERGSDSKQAVRSVSALQENLSQSVLAIAETIGSMKENNSNALKASIQMQQQQRSRKHVIFSNYEGKESMHPRATKMIKNLASQPNGLNKDKKQTPPLHPNAAQAKTTIQSHTNLRSGDGGSQFSSNPTDTMSSQQPEVLQSVTKKPSLRNVLSPLLNTALPASPSRYDEQRERGSPMSGGISRGQSRESNKNHRGIIREEALRASLLAQGFKQTSKSNQQMDLNIASNKFANQHSLAC